MFRFRVMTFNIHKGLHFFKRTSVLANTRALIRDVGADIVLLQEVGSLRGSAEKFDGEQFEFLADEVWPQYAYGKNAVYEGGHHGNAILSKFPIQASHNLDISLNRFEFRGYLECVCELPEVGRSIKIGTTHLSLRARDRILQLRKILAAKVPDDIPYCFGGDFNDWAQKLETALKAVNLEDSFKSVNGFAAQTFPSAWPVFSLDRIYFRNLNVLNAEIVGAKKVGSDHLPLVVEFGI